MTNQQHPSQLFSSLHVSGNPLVLFNIWDAGTARAVANAGATAIATGSASVAGALGYEDGETVPLAEVIANLKRIVAAVDLPVTLDFEGGYARYPKGLAESITKVIAAGAVGINFEDQIIGGEGLYEIDEQCARIAAIRSEVDQSGSGLFINARTDIWLPAGAATIDEGQRLQAALERVAAYANAGADGFFIPGVTDETAIETICRESPVPVNVLMLDGMPGKKRLAELGVARISHGPGPWKECMAELNEAAQSAISG